MRQEVAVEQTFCLFKHVVDIEEFFIAAKV